MSTSLPDGAGSASPDADDQGLQADLRRALARGELSLVYQPIIDAKKRRIAGIEALARWHCPVRGSVPPDRFIPVAEAADLIEAVTDFVLERASRELGPLLAANPGLQLSVNLAAREVAPDRVAHLLGLLSTVDGVTPKRLRFEITERTLLGDSADVRTALALLAAAGATLAIDDFGTGYSSLSYLDSYPIHCLKIDKSFVQRIGGSARTRKLTEAILLMASALDMHTVAEGVETIDQLAFLIGKGCRYIQGYLFSRPLAIAGLAAFVAAFRFPDAMLDAALWPQGLSLPRLLMDNQEQALRLFVKHAPAAVAMFDTSMRYVAASARWLSDYEIADRDVIGCCHYEVTPSTPRRWRDVHARCLAGAVERNEDDCIVHSDGSRTWTSWEVRPLTNAIGDVVGIIVFSENITARRQAELRQRDSEQRLADLLAVASDWVWETDAEHRAVPGFGAVDSVLAEVGISAVPMSDASPAADPAAGWGVAAFIGLRRWEQPGTEPGNEAMWQAHRAELEARLPFRNFVYPRRTRDGDLVWREVSGRPVFDAAGCFQGYRGVARDVTARMVAEATLRAHASQLELGSEMAALGYWQLDVAGRRATWSDGLFRIVGREPGSLRLDDEPSRREVFHPDDRQSHADAVWAAVAAGEPYQRRVRVLRPDGTVREVIENGRPQIASDGSPLGYLGVMHDITDLRRTQLLADARSRENELYRRVFEDLPDCVFVKDLDGTYVLANRATARMMGAASAADLIGRHDRDFLPPDSAERVAADERALLATGRARVVEEHFPDAAGGVGWKLSTKRVMRNADGSAFAIVGVEHDVGELVRVREDAARQRLHNDLYRQGIELLPDLFYVKDAEHRFLVANRALVQQLGAKSLDDVIGRTDADFHAPEFARGFREREKAVMAGGETMLVEGPARRGDGTLGWFSTVKAPLRDADGAVIGIVGHGRDITGWTRDATPMQKRAGGEQRGLKAAATMLLSDGFAPADPGAGRDPLTGLSNRRAFLERAGRRFAHWPSADTSAVLAVFDIDHFTSVNGSHGQAAGDAVLRQLARLCGGLLRSTDVFARRGGEAFVLLQLSKDREYSLLVLERLRSGIADMTVQDRGARLRVTASFGVAIGDGATCALNDLIASADQALYRAKRAGGNRIEIAARVPVALAVT